MKGKDELEGTRSSFTLWLCDFEHQGEKPLGGLVQSHLGELARVTEIMHLKVQLFQCETCIVGII